MENKVLSHLKGLIFSTIRMDPLNLFLLLISLLIMTIAQGVFLFLIGPLVRMFSGALYSSEKFDFSSLFSESMRPVLDEFLLPKLDLDQMIFVLPVLIVFFGLLRSVANFVFEKNQAKFSLRVATQFRERLMTRLLKSTYSEIHSKSAGTWMSMIMNDVMVLQSRVSEILIATVRDFFLVVGSFAVLCFLSLKAAMVLLLLGLPLGVLLGYFGKRIAHYAAFWQLELAKIASLMLEFRSRFEFIRVHSAEKYEQRRFEILNRNYYESIRKSLLLRSGFAPAIEWIGFAVFALALIWIFRFGGSQEFAGEKLIQFFAIVGVLVRPLKNFGEQFGRIQELRGNLNAAFALMTKAAPTPMLKMGTSNLSYSFEYGVTLAQIRCRPHTGRESKFDVELLDLRFQPGKLIAIVGSSGAGKSTLLKCLGGLYHPTEYKSAVNFEELCGLVSYVGQEPFLFAGTIRENLLYGNRQSVKEDEVWRTLKAVELDGYVSCLPKELDSAIRGFALNVSGGQLQRLALARGLLRQKSILVLDEVTSAIDASGEQRLWGTILEGAKKKGQAVLAVTHHMSILPLFDEVILMQAGREVARGTFEQISKLNEFREFASQEGA